MGVPMTAAIIAADPELRRAIRESGAVAVVLELAVSATEVGVGELDELESLRPELVVVEIGDASELSLRLVEHLSDSSRVRPVLVTGPTPSAKLLLDAMRAGASEYLESPLRPEGLRDAAERLAKRRQPSSVGEPQREGRIYTFVGVKGGVGTTMIASNVAVEVRRQSSEQVLLADFRFGLGDAAIHLGVTPRFDVADLVDNLDRIDPGLLSSFLESDRTGVQLLSSPSGASRIGSIEPEQVEEVLRYLTTQYAYTLVDAPDPYSAIGRVILAASHQVILVTTPDVPALRNVERLTSLLALSDGARQRELKLVVNRFVRSRSVPVEEIQRLVNLKVQQTIPDDYEGVRRSISDGEPICRSKAPISRDLARLAAELHGAPGASNARPGRHDRLRRLLGGSRRGGQRASVRVPTLSPDEQRQEK